MHSTLDLRSAVHTGRYRAIAASARHVRTQKKDVDAAPPQKKFPFESIREVFTGSVMMPNPSPNPVPPRALACIQSRIQSRTQPPCVYDATTARLHRVQRFAYAFLDHGMPPWHNGISNSQQCNWATSNAAGGFPFTSRFTGSWHTPWVDVC